MVSIFRNAMDFLVRLWYWRDVASENDKKRIWRVGEPMNEEKREILLEFLAKETYEDFPDVPRTLTEICWYKNCKRPIVWLQTLSCKGCGLRHCEEHQWPSRHECPSRPKQDCEWKSVENRVNKPFPPQKPRNKIHYSSNFDRMDLEFYKMAHIERYKIPRNGKRRHSNADVPLDLRVKKNRSLTSE